MKNTFSFLLPGAALATVLLFSSPEVAAQGASIRPGEDTAGSSTPRFNLHFQATYIYQYKPSFSTSYDGPNSLQPEEERQNSITGTLFFGARLWKGAELYINPEVAGGSGLSGAFGLAASSNGETFRVGNPEPTLYLARGYFSQTFAMGDNTAAVPEGANETGGIKPVNYLRLLVGKMCLGDFLDNNQYANSPRSQFLNWCLMNNGAWDYAANTRGYTYTAAAILQQSAFTYKVALAALPITANGPKLNTNPNEEYSFNVEVDKAFTLKKRQGNIRLLGYHNNGNMGNYNAAIDAGTVTTPPNVVSTRQLGRTKNGVTLNGDLALSKNTGIFARAGWNDGKNETWAFTEADRLVSAGVAIKGSSWNRSADVLSLGMVVNGLSKDHSDYLAAGGLGFQLGDGKLSYANETAIELFYSCQPTKQGIWFTGDYQFILNPGYNKDRGPVNVFSLRLHVEL